MKHEFSIARPEGVKELFPGQFQIFSWLDHVVTAPGLITLVTTRKADGRPNACLHAWGMLVGGQEGYSSVLAVSRRGHTYANMVREGQWCVCIPPWRLRQECFATIQCNREDNDEITDAGLTVEEAVVVRAPRIAECPICLECQGAWDHELAAGDGNHIFVGKVIHAAFEASVLVSDLATKLERLELMCSVPCALNPLNGQWSPGMGFAKFSLWEGL
ncbi:MAG: flavin reductase [Planctomycetes bacterium]|nr:flavin reductase [Planctomycetota bacterium]